MSTALAGLNVPTGVPIGHELLLDIAAQGFSMVRIDCQACGEAGDLELSRLLIHEVLDAGLQPLAIIHNPAQMVNIGDGALFCFWNEWNLVPQGTLEYRRAAICAATMAVYLKRRLYLGGISNPNADGLRFLNQLPWHQWDPEYIGFEEHWYPDNAHGPEHAHFPPSRTRDEEQDHCRAIVGVRQSVVGEIGYNGIDYDEETVADHLAWERRFWNAQGFAAVCVYQINDGEDQTDILNTYGLRRLETGEWKPAVAAFCHAL